MTKLDDLYNIAEESNIPVINFEIKNEKVAALSVCDDDGDCIIAIDFRKAASSAERKVIMAHELGHCERGAFYNQYSDFDIRSRHEYRADKWAVQQITPYDELIDACKQGYKERWQLADYFGVTEDFICRAFEIYRNMGYCFLVND